MPTYVYETISTTPDGAADRFEVRQGFDEPALTVHPKTGASVRRVISGGLAFIGSANTAASDAPDPGCGPSSCQCGRFD